MIQIIGSFLKFIDYLKSSSNKILEDLIQLKDRVKATTSPQILFKDAKSYKQILFEDNIG